MNRKMNHQKKRGRGRPKCKIKQKRDQNDLKLTNKLRIKYTGLYTQVWAAIYNDGNNSNNGQHRFERWSESWCDSVVVSDTTLMVVAGNVLYRLVYDICARPSTAGKWFSCTKKQFMFQIADICILISCVLTIVSHEKQNKISLPSMCAILKCTRQFSLWCSEICDHGTGDILQQGYCQSSMNFLRVMQDAFCFHTEHRLAIIENEVNKQRLRSDILTFSAYKKWREKKEVVVNIYGNRVEYACGVMKMTMSDKNSYQIGKEHTGPYTVLLQFCHLVTSAKDPASRGKIVRHIIGRLKTLIGHNNTIPILLLSLLNPSLTHDTSNRSTGCGPALWYVMRQKHGEDVMKSLRKKTKSSLCSSLNDGDNINTNKLVWSMFDSIINVRVVDHTPVTGMETTNLQISHPISDIYQDGLFYSYIRRVFKLKQMTVINDIDQARSIGLQIPEELDLQIRDNTNDIELLDSCYAELMTLVHEHEWTRFVFGRTISIGHGLIIHYANTPLDQVSIFKNLHVIYSDGPNITDEQYCNMKDPDKYGFSWVPQKKRRKIIKKQVDQTLHQKNIDGHMGIICSICEKPAINIVVGQECGHCCLICIWNKNVGGAVSVSLFDIECRYINTNRQNLADTEIIRKDKRVYVSVGQNHNRAAEQKMITPPAYMPISTHTCCDMLDNLPVCDSGVFPEKWVRAKTFNLSECGTTASVTDYTDMEFNISLKFPSHEQGVFGNVLCMASPLVDMPENPSVFNSMIAKTASEIMTTDNEYVRVRRVYPHTTADLVNMTPSLACCVHDVWMSGAWNEDIIEAGITLHTMGYVAAIMILLSTADNKNLLQNWKKDYLLSKNLVEGCIPTKRIQLPCLDTVSDNDNSDDLSWLVDLLK